ncbi:ParB N-terminal domain-containing protein [Kitasatospora sp. NPDC057965]|uniref:ParB N-terminal domain-containing protein n=1 Tax=Kitasatospora sp. NPDC057965 TaxID=3346291 RepID=UPI0036D94770
MDDDELHALAEDIRENGLLHPVVRDVDGQILDGRNRLKACEILGIEAQFVAYEGSAPRSYVLSANLRRRSLSRGQAAMIAAKACSDSEQEGRSESEQSARSVSEQAGVSLGRIGQASTVMQYASDYVDRVISGVSGLDAAYEVARERKNQASSDEARLDRLRTEDPELANRVVEGELTLNGALAERRERVEEQNRQRHVATQLLCEIVPAVAETRGTEVFRQFDPSLAPAGRTVTREVIAHAISALREMDAVWKQRGLA